MFYPCSVDLGDRARLKRGLVVLTPAESRRLLAKALVGLPEVRWAYENGKLAVPAGSDGMLTQTLMEDRIYGRFYDKGEQPDIPYQDFLKSLGKGDVIVKGANAVDPAGNVGVLLSSDIGGLIGAMFGIASSRGIAVICPVGLEKQVSSVPEAAVGWGQLSLDYSMGLAVGMSCLSTVCVVTEIQALAVMAGVHVRHLGSGGIGGNEGAVTLLLEGYSDNLDKALQIVQSVKGEPRVEVPRHHFG